MRKIIIIIISILFISSGTIFQKRDNVCRIFSKDTIEVDGLRDKLIGSWDYKYSYYEDSCFVLEKETTDLPFNFSYASFDLNTLKGRANKLLNLIESKENKGQGLICYHRKTWVNNSYPVIKVSNNRKMAHVYHYNGSGNGVGKTFEYKLFYVSKDTLVCLGNTGKLKERHIYVKALK